MTQNSTTKAKKIVEKGTIRIKTKDYSAYEKTSNSWEKIKNPKSKNIDIGNIRHTIQLFTGHNNIDALIDQKNPKFLKGQLSKDGKIQGARINILPDDTILDKAYSLFSKNLIIHDEKSHDHWDVMYKNKGGSFNYIYAKDKIERSIKNKYKKVHMFEKVYPKLKRSISIALKNDSDRFAVPMYTLLKTRMRIGNEIYFKAHGHKGLTTLKKKDIEVIGNNVTFNYLAKDGVPRTISENFPDNYINRLQNILINKDNSEFVFTNMHGHPLHDMQFKEAFKKYCGIEFYPHIVRSYYATSKAKEFLKNHKKADKKEIQELFLNIADSLGHKKYVKADHEWVSNYNVTVHHYIEPDIVNKIKELNKNTK